MNDKKIGALIYQLRIEKKLTQKQLAAALHVSDKAISKWERGSGCPDISLISMIGKVFDVNIEYLLCGDLKENELDGGNMKRIKFYVCPTCGNISTMTGKGEFSCCGRKLEALAAQSMDTAHAVQVEEIEDDYFLTFEHEMTKEHHLSFVAYVMYDRVTLIRLYPEQDACVRLPKQSPGEIYFYCVNDGLYKIITPRKNGKRDSLTTRYAARYNITVSKPDSRGCMPKGRTRGKSELHRARITGNARRRRLQEKCNREIPPQ